MTISFWVKPYGVGNTTMWSSPGQYRFTFKGSYGTNYTQIRRSYNSTGSWTISPFSGPLANPDEWVNVTLVYNGTQVTAYFIPLDYDISQGLVQNTHYTTDTLSGAFGNDPITHIVGYHGNSQSGRVYLANTCAFNTTLTQAQVEALFTATKPQIG